MKNVIKTTVACAGVLLTGTAFAQQPKTAPAKSQTQAAAPAPVLRLTPEQQALADAGARIAKSGAPNGVTACVSCHGANGEGTPGAGFPRLAGQSQFYLNRQLLLFADGSRNHPVMSPIAKAMDKQQMLQTSTYYATLSNVPSATPQNKPSQAAMNRGRMLSDWGDESIRVQGCANCHGPGGRGGVYTFPYLAGQHQDYLQAAMAEWKSGARNTDPSGQMPTIAKRMSDADIAAVSAYFAMQPAPPPATQNIPAGSAARPVPPARGGGGGSTPGQGTGTEQGSPTSGGGQGPGGGGGTKVSPQGPMPAR
jgi:cytochrome c553